MTDSNPNPFALTHTQLDIYFDQLHHLHLPNNNVGGYIHYPAIDVEVLRRAHEKLVTEIDVFGLRIGRQGEQILQRVCDTRTTALAMVDFSDEAEPSTAESKWLKNLFATPMPLEENELFKAWLLKLSDNEYHYVGIAHHIIMDGWGFANWAQRLSQLYKQLLEPNVCCEEIAPQPAWSDVVEKCSSYSAGRVYQRDKAFWLKEAAAFPETFLPANYAGEYAGAAPGERYMQSIGSDLIEKMTQLAVSCNVSLPQVYLTALSVYFAKVYGQSSVTLGTLAHNRKNHAEKSMLGVFLSVSPLNLTVNGQDAIAELMSNVAERQKQVYRHQKFPMGHIVKQLKVKSERRLYDVAFNYLKLDSKIEIDGKQGELVFVGHDHEQTPIMFTVWEYGDTGKVEFKVDFNRAWFDKAEVALLTDRVLHILQQMCSAPDSKIADIKVMPQSEARMLDGFSGLKSSWRSFDKTRNVIEALEANTLQTPTAVAVICNEQQLNWQALNEAVNRRAQFLSQQVDTSAGQLIGVCMPRSLNMLVTLLAIWKAGAAYVPLDVNYPLTRLAFICQDTGLKTVVCDKASAQKMVLEDVNFVCLDDDDVQQREAQCSGSDVPRIPNYADHTAYVIHTSGSTGKPKGVVVKHGNVSNFLLSMLEVPGATQSDKLLAVTSISFDIHVLELYLPVMAGAQLIVVDSDEAQDPKKLIQLMASHEVSMMQATPATWKMLTAVNWSPKHAIKALCGGEALPTSLAQQLLALDNLQLWNMYGPTETTVWSCTTEITDAALIDIGKPIANTQVYVLDDNIQHCPVAVGGELYIGGAGVSTGYLNRGSLTAERFVADPFANEQEQSDARLYKTGDLVRLTAKGQLLYLGRSDQQLKIRGFRVEAEEIEQAIIRFGAVSDAAVTAIKDGQGETMLVGYYVPADELSQQSLQAHLANELPPHMIPDLLQAIDALPLTANGKVDKKVLPQPEVKGQRANYIAPRNSVETRLCDIWQKVLGIDAPGVEDNFFNLGGHSLAAVHMSSKVEKAFNAQLSLETIFRCPTIAGLAESIGKEQNQAIKIPAIPRDQNSYGLSFAQQRIWFLQQLEADAAAWYMNALYEFNGDVNPDMAKLALMRVIERHEILRTRFVVADGEPRQIPEAAPSNVAFEFFQRGETSVDLQQITRQCLEHKFDLEQSGLLKMSLFKTGGDNGLLFFSMHHLISDGLSVVLLAREFARQYVALLGQTELDMAPLDVQYIDFCHWQKQQLNAEKLAEGVNYWKLLMQDAPALHALPQRMVKDADATGTKVFEHRIGSGSLQIMQDFVQQHNHTLFMLLQTCFAVHLGRLSNEFDVVLASPVAVRPGAQLEPLIGLFLNTQLYRTEFEHNPSLLQLLETMQAQHLASSGFNHVPFETLVENLNPARQTGRSPLFQILINYNAEAIDKINLGDVTLNPIKELSLNQNKYDITLYIEHNDDAGLNITWQYDNSLFEPRMIRVFAQEFEHFLESALSSPNKGVLSHGWRSATAAKKPQPAVVENHQPLVALEKHARNCPAQPALTFDNVTLDYYTLNNRVNRLANYFVSQGVHCQSRVAIAHTRDLERVLAILAVLKIGACYIPLSAELPEQRIRQMLEISAPNKVVVEHSLVQSKAFSLDSQNHNLLPLNPDLIAQQSDEYHAAATQPQQPAHILFTSGSTGIPKGVVGNFAATKNRIDWMLQAYPFSPVERSVHITSMAFVRAVWEMLVPLCAGVELVLCNRDMVKQPEQLCGFLAANNISRMVSAPSLMKEIVACAQTSPKLSLKHWFVSGEPLLTEQVASVQKVLGQVQLANFYGSTEVMSDVLHFDIDVDALQQTILPVGTPIKGTQAVIVDHCNQLVPEGVIGEIAILGEALANGYINADNHNQAFLPLDFGKVYKTGDLGRVVDEVFYCLGRKNDQVKIRGYRIELGEIVSHLLAMEGVSAATVQLQKAANDSLLVAYLVDPAHQGNQLARRRVLLEQLRRSLPEYMLPSGFVWLDEMPLRPNGKIDKSALPLWQEQLRQNLVAPAGKWESSLLALWSETLFAGAEQICCEKDFFAQGGNSLKITKVLQRIQSKWGYAISYKAFYEESSIQAVARQIEGMELARKVAGKRSAKNKLVI